MNKLSLTKANGIFIQHYNLGNENCNNDILNYNNHKLRHSIGVLEVGRNLIIKIKEQKNLNKDTIKRAEIIFLLHDLGRFYQNDKERILTNKEYEHGDESYLITKKEGFDDIINLSIKYHNKFNIDGLYLEKDYINMNENEKKETIFLTKLIRDADKLQNMIYSIFESDTLVRINVGRIEGLDVNEEILNSLENKQTINNKFVKSVADEVVGKLSRVFDLNFEESLDILKFYGYIEEIITIISKIEGISENNLKRIKNTFLN